MKPQQLSIPPFPDDNMSIIFTYNVLSFIRQNITLYIKIINYSCFETKDPHTMMLEPI